MTASINASSAATAQPARAGVDARPQVQSRRVSLTLGPLGISYSTDQVLWTEAIAAAAAQTLGASGAKGVAAAEGPVAPAMGMDAAGQDGVDGRQAQAQQAEATSRSFTMELAQAWRRQVEEKVRPDQTYDRNGLTRAESRNNASAQGVSGESCSSTEAAEAGAEAEAAAPAATSALAGAAVKTFGGINAEQQTRPPASRMRQAIGAYLACARSFSTVAPMLTAVA